MVTPKLHIRTLALLFVLLLSGMTTEAWAYKVTYHILTLPMSSAADNSNTLAAVDGKRMEAVRVIVDNTTQVGLPPHFKSPLATNFKYYASDNVTNHGATAIYEARPNNKYVLYTITHESTTLAENEAISKNCDIYVTYEYDKKGRRISQKLFMDSSKNAAEDYTFEYDSKGRMVKSVGMFPAYGYNAEYRYTYNSKGFITQYVEEYSGEYYGDTVVTHITTYKYNKAGDLVKQTYSLDDEVYVTEYTYDKYGELVETKHTSPDGSVYVE